MDWHNLPSLSSLRAFEAAARLGTFSAAGRSLNVTHAAVAQQVRGLEAELGLPLAYREGRGLTLTPEGQALAAALNAGFGTIARGIDEVTSAQDDRPLRVSMTPNFANKWLMPRLGEFWRAHPDVPLSLHPERQIIDLVRDGRDIAIRCGMGHWPGVEAKMLVTAGYGVMATPALMGGRSTLTLQDMAALPWIAEEGWPEQFAWMRSIGLTPDALSITMLETEDLARAATRAGYGLHVETTALNTPEISTGTLVEAFSFEQPGFGYYICTRPGPQKPALRKIIKWLLSAAQTPDRP